MNYRCLVTRASTVKQDGVDVAVVGGVDLKVAQRVEVKTVLQRDEMARYSFTISKEQTKDVTPERTATS